MDAKSNRGGKREGAGRKAGGANKKTQEIAAKAMEEGITPLEVMLTTMRDAWAAGDKDLARAVAKDAAPYCHARLANIQADVNVSQHESALDELE